MKSYTYDPTMIEDGGMNQMRFALGDTTVEQGAETCALCDEEYSAIISKVAADGKGFKYAQYKCLSAIMMKFSFEVDFSAGGMSLSMSQRYKRWERLWLRMQKSFQYIGANPTVLGEGAPDSGHYFHAGMQDNTRITRPAWPFREV